MRGSSRLGAASAALLVAVLSCAGPRGGLPGGGQVEISSAWEGPPEVRPLGRALAEWEILAPTVERPDSLGFAAVAIAEGDIDAAFEELEVAIQRQPRNPLFVAARGHLELQLGYLRAAEADFEAALEIDGGNANAWASLGRTRLELGLFVRAARALERAIHLGNDDAEHRVLLARALRGCEHRAEAGRQYLMAMERLREGPTVRFFEVLGAWCASHPGSFGPQDVARRPFALLRSAAELAGACEALDALCSPPPERLPRALRWLWSD